MALSVPVAAELGRGVLLDALIARLAPLLDDPGLHPRDLNALCFRMLELVRELDH